MSHRERRKYHYKQQIQEEQATNLTTKQFYELGVYMGHYLKRSLFDTAKTNDSNDRPHIWSALSGGMKVYFLARDMTVFYDFIKDQFPNAIPVYNLNRKTYSSDTFNAAIYEQIDTRVKGLVIDTGFSGSMVKPILRLSGYTAKKKPMIQGLLLTGNGNVHRDHPLLWAISDGTDKDHYDSSSYRNMVVDLEHSPKLETTNSESTSIFFSSRTKEYYAFKLGLHGGFMGLAKAVASKPIRKQIERRKVEKRMELARKVNESVSNGLFKVWQAEHYEMVYGLEYAYKEDGTRYFAVTRMVKPSNMKETMSTVYRNGAYGNRVTVKKYYLKKTTADKFAKVLNQRNSNLSSKWSLFMQLDKNLETALKQIAYYQNQIDAYEKEIKSLWKN